MIAVTRDVSASIVHCELTHIERVPIDFHRARVQHQQYRSLLRDLGCTVVELPADERYPDCVFVEDTAVVLDDVAVITRPGAESRRGEVEPVMHELKRHRSIERIEAPATIDGGDVLVAGAKIYVGKSERTNVAALQQLRMLTRREVIAVDVHGALQLKTAVTRVGPETLLINRDWVDADVFHGWTLIEVDPDEPFAGNALLVGDELIAAAAFPRTRARLERAGIRVHTVEADELAKAEGGVTCCSLLLA